MGNAAIIIRSVGIHQNKLAGDAERIGARCVAELKAQGHSVLSASCETGGSSLDLQTLDQLAKDHPESFAVTNPQEYGRAAYERYLHASGGKSLVSGAELPGFDMLQDEIKAAWCAAADPAQPRLRR